MGSLGLSCLTTTAGEQLDFLVESGIIVKPTRQNVARKSCKPLEKIVLLAKNLSKLGRFSVKDLRLFLSVTSSNVFRNAQLRISDSSTYNYLTLSSNIFTLYEK